MKKIFFIFGILILLTFAWNSSVQALDLTQYQGFMQPQLGRAKPPRQIPSKKVTEVLPQRDLVNFIDTKGDADAAYKGARLVTLPNQSDKEFSLPADTRIPAALRPLMTERKYPRQGISLSGNSGSMLIPSPGVLEANKSAVSIHATPFNLYDVNNTKYADQDYFDTSVKLVFGAMEGLEVGIDKVFSNQDRFGIPEPTYLNFKYQVPGNVTIGSNLCNGSDGYSSSWVTAGVPAIWVGAGVNFGPGKYQFYYNGYQSLKRSKFGGYNYDYNKAEGYADPAFFMVGGAFALSKATHFVYDFNGDRFSLGLRLNYQKVAYLDATYISDGDYERLPGAIAHKKMQNFLFGGSVIF